MWFAQANCYSVVYLTTFKRQTSLIDLIEYYGFSNTYSKEDGELVYEKAFSKERLIATPCQNLFEAARLNYPRFVCTPDVRIFGVPIKEQYHDVLFPDLKDARQPDLLDFLGIGKEPRTPGNTIRKVYLCRAASRLGPPGSLLVFYKGKSTERPSQAVTAVGVFEDRQHATSQVELARQAGGRSVYSESELLGWTPTESRPVTVINFLLSGYIQPAINQDELRSIGLMGSYPPQSIFEIRGAAKVKLLDRFHLGFQV
jgi:hypothetical protein